MIATINKDKIPFSSYDQYQSDTVQVIQVGKVKSERYWGNRIYLRKYELTEVKG